MHFETLEAQNRLPTIDELRMAARDLHKLYSSQSAYHDAMEGGDAAVNAGWTSGPSWGLDDDDDDRGRQWHGTGASEQVGADHGPHSGDAILMAVAESPLAADGPMTTTHSEESPATPTSVSSSDSATSAVMFCGDRTLAQSILFMSDAILLRDLSQAVAEGDIGRVWNSLKVCHTAALTL